MEIVGFLALAAIVFATAGYFRFVSWYLWSVKPKMDKHFKKRDSEIAYPEPKIIVVRDGAPKRSAADILMNPCPMPKWRKVKTSGLRKRRNRAQCNQSCHL
jgi:hypothetical protein